MKKLSFILLLVLLILLFTTVTFAEIKQWTWTTDKGTFTMNEKIANRIADGEKIKIVCSHFALGTPFMNAMEAGFMDEAEALGITVQMVGPTDGVVEKQVAELETILTAGNLDAIAIGSGDIGSTMQMFEKAWKLGIPVVACDLDSPGAYKLAYVGQPPYYDCGVMGAEDFMKFHPEKIGKLALFAAFPAAPYARGNIQGFTETLEKNGYKLKTIGPFDLTPNKAQGYGVVENTFLANPDITAVYVAEEFVVVVAQYLERNNLQDKVVLVGVNDMRDILEYVKKGIIKQTVSIDPYGQARAVTKVLYDFLTEGKTVSDPFSVSMTKITKENVDEWLAKPWI